MNKYTILFTALFSLSSFANSDCVLTSEEEKAYFQDWQKNFYAEVSTLKKQEQDLATKKIKYCTGSTDYVKILKTLGIELLKTTATTGASIIANNYLAPAPPVGGAAIPQQFNPQTMVIVSSLTTAISASVQNVFTAIKESALTLDEGLAKVHDEIKKESESKTETFSDEQQSHLEVLDSTIAQNIFDKKGEAALKCLNRRQAITALPSKAINVAQYDKNGDPKLAKIIDQNVEELLALYPTNIQEPLSLLVQSIRDNSIAQTGTQVQAFLFGPPGTGKTTFVKRLGKALGMHVCMINLSKIEPDEILGYEYPDSSCEKKNEEIMGKIGTCFVEAGVLNPLIFFDEAGEYMGASEQSQGFDLNLMKKQQIQASFKKVLDANSGSLKTAGMGISFDTSRANYLFASNYEMTDPALLSRMPQIHFARLTRSEKEAAAQFGFEQALKALGHFMPDDKVATIKDVAKDYIHFIIDEDDKRNPGARIVQDVIKELVGHIRLLKRKEEKTNQLQITREALEAFVRTSFNRRERIIAPATPEPVAVNQDQSLL